MIEQKIEVELGDRPIIGQRYASVRIGGKVVFSELVYDNEKAPAEHNIMQLFAGRLRRLLEDE